MTAIVVSFPQERIYRNRSDQIEMRKAYRDVRRKYPNLSPSAAWDGVAVGMAIKRDWDKIRDRPQKPTSLDVLASDLASRLKNTLATVFPEGVP